MAVLGDTVVSGKRQNTETSTGAVKRLPTGRLLGVTATGPVYRGDLHYTIVPIASGLTLLQELALRVEKPDAVVTSSLANRVSGADAHRAWLSLSVQMSAQLGLLSPSARVSFLQLAIGFARRSGRTDGLETVLTSAVNAAWPWLPLEATESVLTLVISLLQKSEFAQRHSIALVDVTQRTAGIVNAGGLERLEIDEWRISRSFGDIGLAGGGAAIAGLELAFQSPLERAIGELFGGGGSSSSDIGGFLDGDDNSGVPGGLPGVGDIPGNKGGNGRGSGQSLDEIAAGLLGGSNQGGVPGGRLGAADLPAGKGSGRGGGGRSGAVDNLLKSVEGVSGFLRRSGSSGYRTGSFEGATPGGPFAPPGKLGSNGSGGETWGDAARDALTGLGLIAGGVLAIASAPVSVPTGVVIAGAIGIGAAAGGFALLAVDEAADAYDKDHPDPPKEEPRKGDLYPDPTGDGGGDPTQLPAYEGEGGGNPTQLPDGDNSGGGTPNTIFGRSQEGASIWDDNFGGPGPTVKPETLTVRGLVGPGQMVDIVQVGPAVVRY